MANEMTVRDMFAAQAMLGLMEHWQVFDRHGCRCDKKDGGDSIAALTMCDGWGSEHPVSTEDGEQSYAEALAFDAFFIADAMMAAREVKEQDEPKPEIKDFEGVLVPYIGGPWHGVPQLMKQLHPFVNLNGGQYHRHYFGIEGEMFQVVYVWSELHSEEAVELVLSAIRK